MNPTLEMALNEQHISSLRSMASHGRPAEDQLAHERRSVRDATGWFLVRLGLRIAMRAPLAHASR